MDDPGVEYFIVRDADSRLIERDAAAVEDWIQTGKSFHCVRDHPSHASSAVFGGLWGGRLPHLRELVRLPIVDLMKGIKEGYYEDVQFLTNMIWPKVNRQAMCHDSVSCHKWVNAYPFPTVRHGMESVGMVYDQYGKARQSDVDILRQQTLPRECARFPDELTQWQHVNGVQGILNGGIRAKSTPTSIPQKINKGFKIPVLTKVYTNVVIWGTQLQENPLKDIKDILTRLGVQFIERDLMALTPNCESGLTCMKDRDHVQLTPDIFLNPNSIVSEKIIAKLKNDSDMAKVTHILCSGPVAMCELYSKLGKSLILIMTERYETGRAQGDQWQAWNNHLSQIEVGSNNLIAANNHYDIEYLRYFTGIQAKYLPNFCGYVPQKYNPTKREVLLVPELRNKEFLKWFENSFDSANNRYKYNTKISQLSTLYPGGFNLSTIADHPAVVFVPNQISMFSACEYYRMAVPLFFPSLDLLVRWHLKYGVITTLTNNHVRQEAARARGDTQEKVDMLGFGSPIQGIGAGRYDPNNERDLESLRLLH